MYIVQRLIKLWHAKPQKHNKNRIEIIEMGLYIRFTKQNQSSHVHMATDIKISTYTGSLLSLGKHLVM